MNSPLKSSELELLRFARDRGYLRPTKVDGMSPTEVLLSITCEHAGESLGTKCRFAGIQDGGPRQGPLVSFDTEFGATLYLPLNSSLSTADIKRKIREAHERFGLPLRGDSQ